MSKFDSNKFIIGSQGHAQVIYATLKQLKVVVSGYIDFSASLKFAELSYQGTDQQFMSKVSNADLYLGLVGYRGVPEKRRDLYLQFRSLGYNFPPLVHPSAFVASDVNIPRGCQIMAGAIVQTNVALGENVVINSGAIVEHDSRIEAHSHIASGSVLCGKTQIGNCTLIGAGATILPSLTIGSDTIVGGGSVVSKCIAGNAVVAGNPARPI